MTARGQQGNIPAQLLSPLPDSSRTGPSSGHTGSTKHEALLAQAAKAAVAGGRTGAVAALSSKQERGGGEEGGEGGGEGS